MKIRPIILCGGSGTRLWPKLKINQPKQFIDFGGWTLFGKTINRIKSPIYDYPIISTNKKYLKNIKKILNKSKVKNYKILLEPSKKNTAPAILSSVLLKNIPENQPLIFFPADHLIENQIYFNKAVKKNIKNLNENNIFLFGIKPTSPSSEYGYLLTKKIKGKINQVKRFIEKPSTTAAKRIIKNNGYWNSGIFFARKDSIINNFKLHQSNMYNHCHNSVIKSIKKNKVYYLNKNYFNKVKPISFDYAILEKSKTINSISLDTSWSDLGSWKEIAKIYYKNIKKFYSKKNETIRPWGKYVNLFNGKNFLVKELTINSNSSISLQKHFHRSEHWLVTQGKPKITINKNIFLSSVNSSVFIPTGAKHRIENFYKTPVKILEIQTGPILKEEDIVRFKDSYNRGK